MGDLWGTQMGQDKGREMGVWRGERPGRKHKRRAPQKSSTRKREAKVHLLEALCEGEQGLSGGKLKQQPAAMGLAPCLLPPFMKTCYLLL